MRNFFERLGWKVSQAMQGCNGSDQLCMTCIIACIVLIVINFFVGSFIITLLTFALLIYATFRQFSKNIYKRQAENARFMELTEKPRRFFQLTYKRIKNRKTTAYFTCEDCGAVYSLPKGKGKLKASCPKCHKQTIRNT
ncbi:MAG: hypothetical protein Q4E12_01730 [Coriobacteriia bacterium]|nr:hypothetical protein [Coriobacteriia bacterium]